MNQDLADRVFQELEGVTDNIEHRVSNVLDAFSRIPQKNIDMFFSLLESMTDTIHENANKDTALGKLFRHAGLPYSSLFPKIYMDYVHGNKNVPLIKQPGVHMIRAKVGGGKSLLSFVLAEAYLKETGHASYFTSPVEKPKLTSDGKFFYVYHRYINLDDYFDKDGKKTKKFNTQKYKVIHKDERHLQFNPRLNNTSEYKKKFIPQQQDEILMRHQGISHVYKYSQYSKLDSQDMQALTYMHDVQVVKDIPLKRWLETGDFNYIPVAIKITTYEVEVGFEGDMKRKRIATQKLPIPFEVLENFDTHAEKYRYAGLPVDYN